MYRVLVTGSRTWHDTHAVFQALDDLLEEHPEGLVVVHGACRSGTDEIARQWAFRALRAGSSVRTEPHPADWGEYGKSAGFVRNAEMVTAGADKCLAFIMPCANPHCRKAKPHGSHGGTHCVDLAERAGIPVRRQTASLS
jgi:hypothetical protein